MLMASPCCVGRLKAVYVRLREWTAMCGLLREWTAMYHVQSSSYVLQQRPTEPERQSSGYKCAAFHS